MVCLSMPRSPEWQETHDQRKSQLYEDKDNGEFWYFILLFGTLLLLLYFKSLTIAQTLNPHPFPKLL